MFASAILLLFSDAFPATGLVLALLMRLVLFVVLYALGWLALPGGRRALAQQWSRLRRITPTLPNARP